MFPNCDGSIINKAMWQILHGRELISKKRTQASSGGSAENNVAFRSAKLKVHLRDPVFL